MHNPPEGRTGEASEALEPPETPPGFIVATECRKAAWDNGFRLEKGLVDGWLAYGSTTAPAQIGLGGIPPTGPWFLALDRADIAAELGTPTALGGPGVVRYVFPSIGELHRVLDRVYRLAVSLPAAPLAAFEAQISDMPRSTEAERLVVQRVGQSLFRDALMAYWNGICPLTGITDAALLRASHIVPWAKCTTDAQRLDVHNGLLLSSLWDAAFDAGLISVADDGTVLGSSSLSAAGARALDLNGERQISGLRAGHRANLAWHRQAFGFG